jgi:hypothetical protein
VTLLGFAKELVGADDPPEVRAVEPHESPSHAVTPRNLRRVGNEARKLVVVFETFDWLDRPAYKVIARFGANLVLAAWAIEAEQQLEPWR